MKLLTDFRKTVETGMDPRLDNGGSLSTNRRATDFTGKRPKYSLNRGSVNKCVRSQRLKTMSMCVRLISVYRVYLVLYRAACWNVVLFNLFKIACQ